MDATTNRLAQLLAANAASATPEDPEIVAGDAGLALPTVGDGIMSNLRAAQSNERRVEAALAAPARTTANPEMTPANGYSGRSPRGALRNYRAMNDGKLTTTFYQVRYEGDDAEALAALQAEMNSRGLA